MKKLMLIAAAATLVSAPLIAKCCPKTCRAEYVNACEEPEPPICKVPCVTYKQVPAIRHVSYSCPSGCLTEQQVDGHNQRITAMHTDSGIEVTIEEAAK